MFLLQLESVLVVYFIWYYQLDYSIFGPLHIIISYQDCDENVVARCKQMQ